MEADLQVREHGELGAPPGVAFGPQLVVVPERLAQQALTFGRVAGPQLQAVVVEITGELKPDLLEDLQVPACDGVARSLERVERRVELGGEAPEARPGLEEAAAQPPAPQRRARVQDPAARPEPALGALAPVLGRDPDVA